MCMHKYMHVYICIHPLTFSHTHTVGISFNGFFYYTGIYGRVLHVNLVRHWAYGMSKTLFSTGDLSLVRVRDIKADKCIVK